MTDDPLLCPACGKEKVTAYFQGTVEVQPSGKQVILGGVDSDSFLSAGCANLDCHIELLQQTGDGRLRNAYVADITGGEYDMPVPAEDEDMVMLAAFRKVVEVILERQGSS